MPSGVATNPCASAPGTAMARTESRSFEREMQPYAEHQQNDADLGELDGDVLVGDEPGGKRADDDARQQVPHQRWQLEAMHQHAEGEGQHQAYRDRRDKWRHMQHRGELPAPP